MKHSRLVHNAARLLLGVGLLATAAPSYAHRMIQNVSSGRVTAGAAVACNDPGGFVHWTTFNTLWFHNPAGAGQPAGTAAALQNAMAAWTPGPSANPVLTYAGPIANGFATDGINTIDWATGNGCAGSCLALTALVLTQPGQVIIESDITFNSAATWRTDGTDVDVQAVAAHEFGHALGIHHTEVNTMPPPTMFAFYSGVGGRSLEDDDRAALRCSQDTFPIGGHFQHWSNYSAHRGATDAYQHYFADVNGDGRTDWIQVARASNDGYVGLAAADGSFQHWTNHSPHRGAVNDYEHYFADVNGDGRADWIQVARASNDGYVGLAAADGSFQHWTNHSPHRGAVNDYEHYFADVNGDGRADWIQVARASNDGYVGLGAADGSFQHWTNHSPHRGAGNAYQHYFADVNGDGRADWIQVDRTSDNGWVGLGAADGSFQHWTNHSPHRGAVNAYQHYFADVNGDGRADWIQVDRTSDNGWVGLGAADGSFQHWSNHSPHRGAVNAYQHYFADINGDGRADWIQVDRTSDNGWVGLARSDGSFQHWSNHSPHRGAVNAYTHFFADVNGDGRTDWIQVARWSNDGWVGLAAATP